MVLEHNLQVERPGCLHYNPALHWAIHHINDHNKHDIHDDNNYHDHPPFPRSDSVLLQHLGVR